MFLRAAYVTLMIATSTVCSAKAIECSDFRHPSSPNVHRQWDSVAAAQIDVPQAQVTGILASGNWTILHVLPSTGEPVYLFYSEPGAIHFVTLWAGVAQPNEETEIVKWVLNNAGSIPPSLAACFAREVTHGGTN